MPREDQNCGPLPMRGGQVRTYCQSSLGLGQTAFIIPAPPECVAQPAMGLRIGVI